jgi:uncharacterized protein (TIGR03083 family)
MGERSTSEILDVLRSTHQRLVAALDPLGEDELSAPSYDDGWSLADVASHLGSGTEIFRHHLDAGARGEPAPDGINEGIWDAWNAKSPAQQVGDAITTITEFLDAADALPEEAKDRWRLALFGMDLDLTGFLAMRLNEQVLHTWDITVALDPASTLTEEAAAIVADGLPAIVGWAAKPTDEKQSVEVRTSSPELAFHLDLGPDGASLAPSLDDTSAPALSLPTEAFVRLVYGRLDPDHTPPSVSAGGVDLDLLRNAFPGL